MRRGGGRKGSRGGGGRGCFDVVLVGEGIIFKRWTHDSRQHVHCPTSGVFRVTVRPLLHQLLWDKIHLS